VKKRLLLAGLAVQKTPQEEINAPMITVFAQLRAVMALCFALALALALRVVAMPWAMAAPEPGLIAICAGGKITYISIDGTPVPDEDRQSDDCPLLGVTAMVLPSVAQDLAPVSKPVLLATSSVQVPVPSQSFYALPPARAPPLFI
jgi:hypothetical protein